MSASVPGAAGSPFGLNLLETYFGPLCDSFAAAETAEQYRSIGAALGQLLLDFAQQAHVADAERMPAPDASLTQWPEAAAAVVFGGDRAGTQRSAFVAQLEKAWRAADDLAADVRAGRDDTELAMELCRAALELGVRDVGRFLQQRPEVCPSCGGAHLTVPDKRARCLDCGWYSPG